MQYAAGLRAFIDRCNDAMPPDFYRRPLDEQRAMYEGLAQVFHYSAPSDVTVTEHTVEHGARLLRVRTYRPADIQGNGTIAYLRGGGFVVGSLDTHHSVVAELARNCRLNAIAVDFRMSPETPFPGGLEDIYDALCLLRTGRWDLGIDVSGGPLVVAGDSSGANMAVAVAMMCRDRHGPRLDGMGLISPVLDFTRWRQGGDDAPLLTGGEMEYYTACYCPTTELAADAYASPLVSGTFHDLPPAYIMGAELDSLRVDGDRLAEQLHAAGVAAEHVVEPGLVHSAVRARGYSPAVQDAWERFCIATARLAQGRLANV